MDSRKLVRTVPGKGDKDLKPTSKKQVEFLFYVLEEVTISLGSSKYCRRLARKIMES
jgi:hypothetical protein